MALARESIQTDTKPGPSLYIVGTRVDTSSDSHLPKVIGPEYWEQFADKKAQKHERLRRVHEKFMRTQAEAAIREAAIKAAAEYSGRLIVCTTQTRVIEGTCAGFEHYSNGTPRDYGNTLRIQEPSLPELTPVDIRGLRKVELFDTEQLPFVGLAQGD